MKFLTFFGNLKILQKFGEFMKLTRLYEERGKSLQLKVCVFVNLGARKYEFILDTLQIVNIYLEIIVDEFLKSRNGIK